MPDTPNATQDGRMLRLSTPLGENVLLIRELHAVESIGNMYRYVLTLLSECNDIDAAALLGQQVSLSYRLDEQHELRQFNGIVSHFSLLGRGDKIPNQAMPGGEGRYYYNYQAEVCPGLWRLTLGSHCRFFHDMNVRQIIKAVLDEYQIEFEDACINEKYRVFEHCAQYNESDYAFFCRLLEREGIYYYFVHANGIETLHLADAFSAHDNLTPSDRSLVHAAAPDESSRLAIYGWRQQHTLTPQRSEVNAFDFQKPIPSQQQALWARSSLPGAPSAAPSPGIQQVQAHYTENEEGKHYATVQLQARQAQALSIDGESLAGDLVPGACFKLTGQQDARYLLTRTEYTICNNAYSSDSTPAQPAHCRFQVIPAAQPYRMPIETPRPLLSGPQTAIVIGDKEGDIHLDPFGRVQVQFHWEQFAPPQTDKRKQRCWVRVAQHWAGKGWGAVFTPRAGQEVIVNFINGDIDQPLVTGSVYNAANKQPYPLPDQRAVSTIRSRSTEGDGFNELRFIDTKGQEQLFLHAEKDWKTYVKHDALTWIGQNRHLVVEGEQRLLVKKGHDSQIKGDQRLLIEADQHAHIKGQQRLLVSKDQHCQIDGQQIVHVQGKQHVQIDGAQLMETGGDQQIHVKGALRHKTVGKISLAGSADINIEAGTKLVLEAKSISIKAGASFIKLGPDGIFIAGPMVKINSGGSADDSSAAAPDTPSKPDAPMAPEAPTPNQQDDGSQEVC